MSLSVTTVGPRPLCVSGPGGTPVAPTATPRLSSTVPSPTGSCPGVTVGRKRPSLRRSVSGAGGRTNLQTRPNFAGTFPSYPHVQGEVGTGEVFLGSLLSDPPRATTSRAGAAVDRQRTVPVPRESPGNKGSTLESDPSCLLRGA